MTAQAKGRLISFDGLGGSGKTTQINKLVEKLQNDGHEVIVQKFPDYESPTGKIIASYLKGELGDPESICADYISSLYALDRAAAYPKINQHLLDGKWVILDRSKFSGLAYQAAHEGTYGDEDMMDYMERWSSIEEDHLGMRRSHFRFYLSIDGNRALGLIDDRGKTTGEGRDVHEGRKEFTDLVINNFEVLADSHGITVVNVQHQDGSMRDPDKISDEIYQAISSKLESLYDFTI